MSDLNSVVISGRLTCEPELKSTEAGHLVLTLSIAVNDRVKQGGKWADRPSFFDVTVFGAKAEWLSGLAKGAKVAVQGRLRQDRWESKDGRRSKVVIVADRVDAPRQALPVEEVSVETLPGSLEELEEVPF